MDADIAIIILTHNEEKNIAQALQSVQSWTKQMFVLDSFSSDRTLEIAQTYGAICCQHRFNSFDEQRNYALEQLPISTEWVFFLDADERITEELRQELSDLLASKPRENGFYVSSGSFGWGAG